MNTGETDLRALLSGMDPRLDPTDYVFVSVPTGRAVAVPPLMRFQEAEGDTLIIAATEAAREGLPTDRLFRRITLSIHSDLHAVGLTAAVAARLTEHGLSANVVAAYFHDHIFIASENADLAHGALRDLARDSK